MKKHTIIILLLNFMLYRPLKINNKNNQDTYELIPDEISFDMPLPAPPSPYILNYNKYQADLEQERIDDFEDSQKHNGKVYYKDPFTYYGPKTTYKNIPQMTDIKFQTPVQIADLDNFNDKEAMRKELEGREHELTNRLLFTNLSKKINKIKQNDFLPYYDATYEDKLMKINRLKNRIIQLRHYLNINNEEVNLYVEVRNSTFPQGPLDIIKHLNESYYYVDTFNGNVSNITNGKYKSVDDIYDERHSHLSKNFNASDEDKMLKAIKGLNSGDDLEVKEDHKIESNKKSTASNERIDDNEHLSKQTEKENKEIESTKEVSEKKDSSEETEKQDYSISLENNSNHFHSKETIDDD